MKNIRLAALAIAAVCLVRCSTTTTEAIVDLVPPQPQVFYEFYESELFKNVQLQGIFPDSKTFVDATPTRDLQEIEDLYQLVKNKPGFDLKGFVEKYFQLPDSVGQKFSTNLNMTMKRHIEGLWPVLTRNPDEYEPRSSLIPLPHPYIVPGGRFREIYYWDSYFTMEGLMLSGQEEMAKNMVNNFSHLIDTIGFVPNGNRAYYRGRSQPPFYSLMVARLTEDNTALFLEYHDKLLEEYAFWMKGEDGLSERNPHVNRVVRLSDSTVLNRYWDEYQIPRPESFKEDYELVHEYNLPEEETYRHLRAGAESGWDFSSRWFKDHENLSTINTTNIIPVDLNALLYHLEVKIAQGYNWNLQFEKAAFYFDKATKRKEAMDIHLWDEENQFYMDYDITTNAPTGVFSLAAAYPLFFKMASEEQARGVMEKLKKDFLKPGGFVTTTNFTGQQWDAPNGWAPLQWITVNGLYKYGYESMGRDAAQRWLDRNREVYQSTGKMMEKYNVIDIELLAGGGEYGLQDGFGWTNGIALALMNLLEGKYQVERVNK